jgi:hypothetical protein
VPERGPYRSLYICIQDDPDFQLLSSDERLAFYTLKFSPLGNVAGIFVYHPGVGERHSGLPRGRFEAALKGLEEGRWIVREGPLIWIRNGLRFEPGYSMADSNKKKGIEKLLCGLPNMRLLQQFAESYGCEAPSGPLRSPFEAPSKPSASPPPYKDPDQDPDQEKEQEKPLPAPKPGADVRDGFASFWSLYPKKREKPTAEAAFKVARKKADLETILSALRADIRSKDWEKDGGEFIPYPAKWLKRERWLDEDMAQFRPAAQQTRNRLLTPEERGE